MKRILILITFLLFIPVLVHAEVKITNVELVDSKTYYELEKNPSFKDLTINYNLKFSNKDDFAKYKVILKNDTKKDYEIEEGEKFNEGEFIKYEFTLENSSNKVIKANEERVMYITATYVKEVPVTSFTEGNYNEKNNMTINLSNDDKQVNPKTNSFITIALIVLGIATISLIIILYNHHKIYHFTLPLLLLLAIPITIFALEKISLKIETNIEITKPIYKTKYHHCNDFYEPDSTTSEGYLEIVFEEGMTWEDYFNSEYANILNPNTIEQIQTHSLFLINKEYSRCVVDNPENYCENLYTKEVSFTDTIEPIDENSEYLVYSVTKELYCK